ncbi:hypothetical protein AB5I41_08180 [Sphingomonas sp. MMS24-JH45]
MAEDIEGLAGDDWIQGLGGADRIDGGAGIDTASYAASAKGVTVDLTNAAFKGGTGQGGDAEGDVLISIENLLGSAHDDVLIGNHLANLLDGAPGRPHDRWRWRRRLRGGRDRRRGGRTTRGGNDTVRTSLGAYMLAAEVELVIYTGKAGVTATGNGLANVIDPRGRGGSPRRRARWRSPGRARRRRRLCRRQLGRSGRRGSGRRDRYNDLRAR